MLNPVQGYVWCWRLSTVIRLEIGIQARVHTPFTQALTQQQIIHSNYPKVHVFGLWEEIWVLGEKPYRHETYLQLLCGVGMSATMWRDDQVNQCLPTPSVFCQLLGFLSGDSKLLELGVELDDGFCWVFWCEAENMNKPAMRCCSTIQDAAGWCVRGLSAFRKP